jgi:predicted alpha/beta-hydrolase family hydrolase
VESYNLSPQVQLGWITSGDHSFKPTRSSGLSEGENWATVGALSDKFLRQRFSG